MLLDLSKPEGKTIFKRLVAEWGDVVLQNFRPGVLTKLGLTYEELVKIRPDLIMINISIFGQSGPYGHVAAWGGATSAITGHYSMSGWPDRGPTNPGLTVTGDILGPFYAVGILVAALDYRRRTGKGQNIDFAQIEALTNVFGPWYMDAALNRRVPQRPGNRCPQAAPHGVYRCTGDDQWCAIAVLSEDNWRDFCAVIGSPSLADDPRFVTVAERKKNEDELDRIVEGWTMNKTGREIMDKLQKKGIPSGPVYDISDIMDHDLQARYRKLFVPLNHPGVGTIREREMPFRLSLTPPDLKPAPPMGQDTEYFLRDVLSMSDEEIATLVINEVLA